MQHLQELICWPNWKFNRRTTQRTQKIHQNKQQFRLTP